MSQTVCELCTYYRFDEDSESYVCDVDLDEDDMGRFLSGTTRECAYFQLYDEYRVVQKQN